MSARKGQKEKHMSVSVIETCWPEMNKGEQYVSTVTNRVLNRVVLFSSFRYFIRMWSYLFKRKPFRAKAMNNERKVINVTECFI